MKFRDLLVEDPARFTLLGKLTIMPIINMLCWIMVIILLPFIPIFIGIEALERFLDKHKLTPNIQYRLYKLFYKY